MRKAGKTKENVLRTGLERQKGNKNMEKGNKTMESTSGNPLMPSTMGSTDPSYHPFVPAV